MHPGVDPGNVDRGDDGSWGRSAKYIAFKDRVTELLVGSAGGGEDPKAEYIFIPDRKFRLQCWTLMF